MTRLGIALALALASVSSVACTAAADDGQEPDSKQAEDVKSEADGPTGKVDSALSCQRFGPNKSCATLQTYCNNHGGQLVCDLLGNCTCVYARALANAQTTAAPTQSEVK